MKKVLVFFMLICMLVIPGTLASANELSTGTIDASKQEGSIWVKSGNEWYWKDSTGTIRKSIFLNYKGCTYYLISTGKMSTGWEQIDGAWYYFHDWGGMYKDCFVEYKGCTYHLSSTGKMSTGWEQIDGTWYYFHDWGGMYKDCFTEYKGCTYHLSSTGKMSTGWEQIDGTWYYFHDWGGMYKNCFVEYKGCTYHLSSTGKMSIGWEQIDGIWYYFHDWGGMYKDCFVEYKGYTYHLNDEGKMAVGWNQIHDSWYYFKNWGGCVRGWNYLKTGTSEKNWYYFSQSGELLSEYEPEFSQTVSVEEIPSDDNVMYAYADPDYTVFPEDVLKEETVSVVYGEIVDASYRVLDSGRIITIEKVRVDETLNGEDLTGKEITVYKEGGYATLRAYIASYPEEVQEGLIFRFTKDENMDLSTRYICNQYWKDTIAKPGSKYILRLQNSETDYADYVLGFNYYNEYLETETGLFHSNVDDKDYTKSELSK